MMAQSVPGDFELVIRQQPKNGCVALTKGKGMMSLFFDSAFCVVSLTR